MRSGIPLENLERRRDLTLHRLPRLRVHSEASALRFVNEAGFCLAFSKESGHLPCLWVAVCGRRDPVYPEHTHFDPELSLTWRLKDSLPAGKKVYYGRLIGGKPTMVALDLLPAFYALRGSPHDEQYVYDFEDGKLSRPAKRVMDALMKESPQTTKALKRSSGLGAPGRRGAFDAAIADLQRRMLITMTEARYEPSFSYVWDRVDRRYPKEVHKGRRMSEARACDRIAERLFRTCLYGNRRQLAGVLGRRGKELDDCLSRLESRGVIEGGRLIDGLPGRWWVAREALR